MREVGDVDVQRRLEEDRADGLQVRSCGPEPPAPGPELKRGRILSHKTTFVCQNIITTITITVTLALALLRQLKQGIQEQEVVEGFQVAPQAPLAHTCTMMVSE